MELDVRLTRSGDESWGFRLIGGVDFNMPLTIVKVVPNSPADRAGLQNGDLVSRIQQSHAEGMSHEDCRAALAQAGDTLSLAVVRGLYDLVLDDYEPIYEPIDPADSDQQLPTEVPSDTLDIAAKLPNFDSKPFDGTLTDIVKPQPNTNDPQNLEDLRSLTESPFILSTKPYRPFSTEPITEVPPLEDPIILNPNYQDEFAKIIEEYLPKTRFKLPISEQYDPDGTKQKKTRETNEVTKEITKDVAKEFSTTVQEEMIKESKEKAMKQEFEMKEQVMTKDEVNFLEEIKQEIDLNQIEMTASSIVDESIERALVVTEEIKNEIDVAISESYKSESKLEQSVVDSHLKSEIASHEEKVKIESQKTSSSEVKELVEVINKTTEVAMKAEEQSAETVAISNKKNKEHKLETVDNLVEHAILDNTEVAAKETKLLNEYITSETDNKSFAQRSTVDESVLESYGKISRDDNKTAISDTKISSTEIQSQNVKEATSSKTYSSAEKRVYALGLQTIPNIRGTLHSFYHFDMLLKTFFIHLTDVMVALSRFILTEPAQFKASEAQQSRESTCKKQEIRTEKKATFVSGGEEKSQQEAKEKVIAQEKMENTQVSKAVTKNEQAKQTVKSAQVENEVKMIQKAKVEDNKIEQNDISLIEENNRFEELEDRRKLSGSRMAQLTEKRSDVLMKNMEAVITEFESKSGNEDIEIVRERRSRSRSRVDTPVEMLNYEERSQEKTEQSIATAVSGFTKNSKSELGYDCTDSQNYSSKDGKNMYIAIVESHVYTNKDAILEEHLDSSETSSVQAAEIVQDMKAQTVQFADEKTIANLTEEVASIKANETIEQVQAQRKEIVADEQKENIVEKPQALVQSVDQVKKIQPIASDVTNIVTTKESLAEKESKSITVAKKKEDLSSKKEGFLCKESGDKIVEVTDTQKKEQLAKGSLAVSVIEAKKTEDFSSKKESFVRKESVDKKVDVTDTQKKEQLAKGSLAESVIVAKKTEDFLSKKESFVNKELVDTKVEVLDTQKKEQAHVEVVSFEKDESFKKHYVSVKEEASAKKEVIESVAMKQDDIISITDVQMKQQAQQETKSAVKEDEFVTKQLVKAKEVTAAKETVESLEIKQQALPVKEEVSTIGKKVLQKENLEEITFQDVQKSKLFQESKAKSIKETILTDGKQLSQTAVVTDNISEDTKIEIAKNETQIVEQKSISQDEIVSQTEHKIAAAKITKSEATAVLAKQEKSQKVKEEVKKSYKEKDESTALKISKEQIVEQERTYFEVDEQIDVALKNAEINEYTELSQSKFESKQIDQEPSFLTQESSFVAKLDQKTSFVAKSLDIKETKDSMKLKLDTEVAKQRVENQTSVESTIDTPTPATVPPTPLTDEYVFSLTTTLPKREGPPIPRDCTPSDDDEDPHIVKKGLVPSIDAAVGEPKVFDPPLPTPPTSPRSPPTSPKSPPTSPVRKVYCKPGLRGGSDRDYNKEEILEIGRKSSLLASAIDQTIKSIEEYKEEVGIKKEEGTENQNGVIYNGYTTVVETKVYDTITESHSSSEVNLKINNTEEQIITNGTSEMKPDIVENCLPVETKVETEVMPVKIEEVAPLVKPAEVEVEKKDPLEGYRPVHFDPEEFNAWRERRAALGVQIPQLSASQERELYKTEKGEVIGTNQGIVDGLEEAVVDTEIAKEMGKPGISEEKIAELISGESEMLREAHVMGVDFKRIKPIVESLKDSEVLKALNEEVMKNAEERKKEERKWTTFLQKPKRPVPKTKSGFQSEEIEESYKVKIVKQPKPKVAPDYKPKDFNTGLLPWEERALREPTPPPVDPEDPILVPEDPPEVLEAVDPLPESEVPDLEDSGIPLPPPKEPTPPPEETPEVEPEEELDLEAVVEETQKIVEESLAEEMERTNLAEQLIMGVQNMVDPNAPLQQQVAQMRAQLAALAQLPGVIQQSLEMVTKQLSQLSQLESAQTQQQQQAIESSEPEADTTPAAVEEVEGGENQPEPTKMTIEELPQEEEKPQEQTVEEPRTLSAEEVEKMKKEEELMLEEQRRVEKQKKELMEAARIEHESRQVKQRPTPRVGRPKPVFGPATPQERPLVLPGGRKWRKPQDAYNEAFIAETLTAQAEIIAGKAKGINFMKYEKPPVSLDHLKDSDTYKLVHDLETTPCTKVAMLGPAMAEEDYREKCRSMTPCPQRLAQQVQP